MHIYFKVFFWNSVFLGFFLNKLRFFNLKKKLKFEFFLFLYFKHVEGYMFGFNFEHFNIHSSVAGLHFVLDLMQKPVVIYKACKLLNRFTGERNYVRKVGFIYKYPFVDFSLQNFLIKKFVKLKSTKWYLKQFWQGGKFFFYLKFLDCKYLFDGTHGLGFSGWTAPFYLKLCFLETDFYFINLFLSFSTKNKIYFNTKNNVYFKP